MGLIIFSGARLYSPKQDHLSENISVAVEDGLIKEVSAIEIASSSAQRINLKGKTLMPGLIDAHVHVNSYFVDLGLNAMQFASLAALRTGRIMNSMLMRGFTTVRDLGGADLGLVQAVNEGILDGPRLIICGKALSQTGGHTDFRNRSDDRDVFADRLGAMGRICDGVAEVRKAAREEIRAGAHFIKIMANGGVASPNDPIHALQFSREEIAAAVEEAKNAGTYVAAHVYTDEAIRRAVELGVHSLEHCNLIQPETAAMAAKAGCIAVCNLVAYEGLINEGKAFGLSNESYAKIETVRTAGMRSLEIMRNAGLEFAYGSDLLGGLMKFQSDEFSIRARVLPAHEILRSATLVAAKLCFLEGKAGDIAPNYLADIIVVDGDPLADVSLLEGNGRHLSAIMRDGKFFKNTL